MYRIKIAEVDPTTGMTEQEYISWLSSLIKKNREAKLAEEQRQAEVAQQQEDERKRQQRAAARYQERMNQTLKHAGIWFGVLGLTWVCDIFSLAAPELCDAVGMVALSGTMINTGIWWEKLKNRGGAKR